MRDLIMEKKPIHVLNILADFKKGGIQAEVMYPARLLDPQAVRFDALLLSDTTGFYEEEFARYGEIYRIPLKRKKTKLGRFLSVFTNFFWLEREMERFFREHPGYDAVHARHILHNAPCILAAKRAGVPVRIAHCAVDRPRGQFRDRAYITWYLSLCARVLRRHATHCFGVTKSAVEYLCGQGNGIVMKNPTIALDRFDPAKYRQIRPDGRIHLLMVGSYGQRKNQRFAVDILRALPEDADATFIGYPRTPTDPYLPKLKQYAEDLGLSDRVRFLPQDADIPLEMAKATVLLIPSLQEGLPNVALEAQAMGLSCFVSSEVSDECDCGLCSFYPLALGPEGWAEKIQAYVAEHGYGKRHVDMSQWDNYQICLDYLEYWRGKPMPLKENRK